MSIKYACFISYPHTHSKSYIQKFVDDIKNVIDNELELFLSQPVYQDKYYLKHDAPNEEVSKQLGQAICESASWIIIFSPIYKERIWCLREFIAMLQIENRRKPLFEETYSSTKSMIFPFIVRRGDIESLPPQIKRVPYYDISKFMLLQKLTREIRDRLYSITKEILEHYFNLMKLYRDKTNYRDYDCNDFTLPLVDDLKKWYVPF